MFDHLWSFTSARCLKMLQRFARYNQSPIEFIIDQIRERKSPQTARKESIAELKETF